MKRAFSVVYINNNARAWMDYLLFMGCKQRGDVCSQRIIRMHTLVMDPMISIIRSDFP